MMRHQLILLSAAMLLAMLGMACDEVSLPEGACTQLPGDFASSFPLDEDESFALDVPAMTETDSGLCYEVLVEGGGERPASGVRVEMWGRSWISNGTVVPSVPFVSFQLDEGEVFEGYNEAAGDMTAGELRRLIIPPELAQGDEDYQDVPAGAILVAEVLLTEYTECANTSAEFDPSLSIDVTTFTPTGTGLCALDEVLGTGPLAASGDSVQVAYTGWLIDGYQFDSGASFSVLLGSGGVIPGFDEGVTGMQVGGQRTIIIPSELAYGDTGQGDIPPNATLLFDIELLSIGN